VGADPAVANGTDQSPTAAPTAPPSAPVAQLLVRSDVAARVKLARLADLATELAGILRELSQVPLAVRAQEALMCSVSEPTAPAHLLSVSDVAERLQLSERTVRRLRQRGELPAGIELAGVVRWTPESIEEWIRR
jgi:predicted DNA-binding transcriptional regulator AlpA